MQEKVHRQKKLPKYGIPHISTGDIFRANIKNGTELGKKAKNLYGSGTSCSDELVVDLVVDRVSQDDCTKGYVLDGFPRTIPQAEALDKALEAKGQKMDYAIDVDVPDEKYCKAYGWKTRMRRMRSNITILYMPHRRKTESVMSAEES